MNSVNWTEVLTILIGFAAFFIYLLNRLDNIKKELNDKIDATSKNLNDKIDATSKNLNDKIDATSKNLNDKIEAVQKDLNRVASKVSNIEGQITQITRPGVIPFDRYLQHPTLPPEDEDGNKKAQGQ